MDYVKPADLAKAMAETGRRKLALPPRDLMIRGILSGAILGVATSLAFTGTVSTGQPLVGALIFPVGLIFIVLLGLELITASFPLLPLPWLDGGATAPSGAAVLTNWGWVFLANLIGSVVYGGLLAIALTDMGKVEPAEVAASMPIFVFFAQGFEHSVVNMFIVPTGMMLGAKITVADWWLWNQIPVTLGNLVGGFVFTGLAIYTSYKPAAPVDAPALAVPSRLPAE